MEITEKDIESTVVKMHEKFTQELMSKTKDELEDYWHFKYAAAESLKLNMYNFHKMLMLYGNFCRRWEEKKNGVCCVVERVGDKYLMPKIEEFSNQIRERLR